jgi:LacI family transcriptional regulator
MASKSSQPSQEIALAIRVGVPHLGRVAQGIRNYAGSNTNWRFLISPETHDLPPGSLKGWQGDGVIAQCNTREEERILQDLNCPVVNISGVLSKTEFPRVRNDYREVGRRAAGYLRERGFRRFGFYGVEEVWYSEEIETGFCDSIDRLGLIVQCLRSTSSIEGVPRWDHGQEELESWLLSMKTPFAVMAAHDPRATMVIRACERVGLQVPTDVAVIGVNDDTVTCETCMPSLTSIRRNGREVGKHAAEMLHHLITDKPVQNEIVILPGDVFERDSTRTLAIDHPALAAAVKFMRTQYLSALSIDQIAGMTDKSRRWLEESFRKELNCSPSEFLGRIRVQEAKKRFEEDPSIGLGAVAKRCGFSGTRQMNTAFQRELGCSARVFQESL